MKNPDGFSLYVFMGRKEIYEGSEIIGIQPYGQGVDGEIPAKQVQFYTAHFHSWKGCREFIILHPGRGYIDLESVFKDDDRCSEFSMRVKPGSVKTRELFCEFNTFAFDDDIDVLVSAIKKKVSYEAPDHVSVYPCIPGRYPDGFQGFQ